MTYIDIHTHQHPVHPDDIAIISVDLQDPQQADLFTSKSTSSHYYSVGIHPWKPDASLLPKVRQYTSFPSVVAIGETGLDKLKATTPAEWDLQRSLFEAQIRLSEEVKKPLIIHCVKAWEELLYIRKAIQPTTPWIIHGFRGKKTLATQLLNTGCYLSFGSLYQQDALRIAWDAHRLLAETDNKTIDIRTIYEQIADSLHISLEELSEEIEKSLCPMNQPFF